MFIIHRRQMRRDTCRKKTRLENPVNKSRYNITSNIKKFVMLL